MGHRHHLLFLSQLQGRALALVLLLLLLIATAHAGAGGHAPRAGAITGRQQQSIVGSMNMMRSMSMVGSRPPSCAGRCWWCGGRRCEAVQVPITPQEQDKSRRHGHGSGPRGGAARGGGGGGGASSSSAAAADQHHQHQHQLQQRPSTSSYEDHSNYKPLSWRCKCSGG